MRIFDRGEYELVGRSEDRLTFELEGERLAGIWHLVHTGLKGWKGSVAGDDVQGPAPAR